VFESPFSNVAGISTCPVPYGGPTDVAFIIDNTYSMHSSLMAIQQAITAVLNDISNASGGDFRLAIVTPDTDNDNNPTNGAIDYTGHDMVVVRLPFTNNISIFTNTLNSIQIGNGSSDPESTDECLNTVVNALSAVGRLDTNNCASADKILQTGDFRPDFRTNSIKLAVLITDIVPSGFCDSYSNLTTNNAHIYALEAMAKHIQINAIQMVANSDAIPVMQDYSTTSCGWYTDVTSYSDEAGIENAIVTMFYLPGACN
jgi:hypothetical protein